MKKYFLLILVLATPAFCENSIYWKTAAQSVDKVWQRLAACGLNRLDARDPRLPFPNLPADSAVLNKRGQILAYYWEMFGNRGGISFGFKNPNGSWPHTVSFLQDSISFNTPNFGTVAQSSRYWVGRATQYHFRCRQMDIPTLDLFEKCIEREWVNNIANQLCRYRN